MLGTLLIVFCEKGLEVSMTELATVVVSKLYPSPHLSSKYIPPKSCPHVRALDSSGVPNPEVACLLCLVQNSHKLSYVRNGFSTCDYKDPQLREGEDLFSKSKVLPGLSQRVENKPSVGFKCRQRKWWFILQTSGAANKKKIIIHRQSLFPIKIGRVGRVINLILLELYWEIKMLMGKIRKKIASPFLRK